jgi:hypothetical protein
MGANHSEGITWEYSEETIQQVQAVIEPSSGDIYTLETLKNGNVVVARENFRSGMTWAK